MSIFDWKYLTMFGYYIHHPMEADHGLRATVYRAIWLSPNNNLRRYRRDDIMIKTNRVNVKLKKKFYLFKRLSDVIFLIKNWKLK